MPAFRLALINEANLAAEEVSAATAAFAEFLSMVAAFWPETSGSSIRVTSQPEAGEAQVILAPNTTQANTMGYHQTTPSGDPVGIVELDACRLYSWPWTVAASHEIAELLINPQLARFVTIGGRTYGTEICDPVTSDQWMIGGIAVSNFTTPEFWNPSSPQGSRFDYLGNAEAPIPTIPHRGWMEWQEGSAWTSRYGAEITSDMIRYMHTRRGRRHSLKLRTADHQEGK